MDSIESRQESCGKEPDLSIKRGLVLVDSDKGQTVVPQFETCGRVKKTTFPQQLTVTVVIFFLLTYHSLKKVKANLA